MPRARISAMGSPFFRLLFAMWFAVALCVALPTKTTSQIAAPTPSTIVDVLSAEVEFSYFLRTVQRKGMVPVLNGLANVTLLAPVNLAFAADEAESFDVASLMRYIINQRVRVGYMGQEEMLFETLSETASGNYTVSIAPDFQTHEYVVDKVAAIVEPDVYAKHQQLFVQGIDRMLPKRPSGCEILMGSGDVDGHKITFVQQLFQLLLRRENAAIDGKKKKKKHPKQPALPDTCEQYLNNTRTVFIPTDAYINSSLSSLEQRYYLALYHDWTNPDFDTTDAAVKEMKRDVYSLLNNLLLPEYVLGANGTGHPHTAKSGTKYHTGWNTNSSRLRVNKRVEALTSAVASDKVLHVFGDQKDEFFAALDIPLAPMIPRKALFALHFSNFADELRMRNLGDLIDGSTCNQTLLIDVEQRDDVFEEVQLHKKLEESAVSDASNSAADSGSWIRSTSAKQMLQYQFLDGAHSFAGFSRQLIDTYYCSKKRIGSCYKVKIATTNTSTIANDEVVLKSEPVRCANETYIYFADDEIEAPINFKQTMGEMISKSDHKDDLWHLDARSCFRTIEILKQFKLLSLADNGEGYTVFLPISSTRSGESTRTHWDRLGLVFRYLESNPKEFKRLIQSLFVEGLIYSDFRDKKTTFRTLYGDPVHVKHHSLLAAINDISLNETQFLVPLAGDILFNQGVIQAVDQVLIPESLQVSATDLIKSTFEPSHKAHYILDMLNKVPHVATMVLGKRPSHSLLIPSPLALKDFNVTTSFPRLDQFLQMHLIPNSELPKLLACIDGGSVFQVPSDGHGNTDIIATNHSDVYLSCRYNARADTTYLRFHERDAAAALSYDKNHEVTVVSHGCSLGSVHQKSRNCVFLINKPLNLDWLDHSKHDNFLHIHLGFVSVGVGIILGLVLFGAVFFLLVICLEKPKKAATARVPDDFDDEPARTFMDVRSSEEESLPWDRGYETDYEVASETENLLPKTKHKTKGYRATGTTAPVSIRTQDITKHLNRERNLPNY